MKAAVILILLMTITTYGQTRNSSVNASLPTPAGPGQVTISLREYDRLVELSTRKAKTPDTPPLPFVLTRAVFKLRVENQTLLGTVTIDGSSLYKGPVKAPLTTGMMVVDATQSGNPLPLLWESGSHAAILSGPGPFGVSLGVASALTIDAGRASFMLPVPAAGTSLLSLELPGNHANVHVDPGIVTSRTTANGNTLVEATLEPGKQARVWWTTREVAAPVAQREVRFLSDVKTVVSVGDAQLRLTALCDINVIQGEALEFKIPVPDGFDLTTASGSTLESSDLSGGILTLRVHDPGKRNHQFLIAIERSNHETKVESPLFTFQNAQRETGELLVEGAGAMELKATESGGLRRMDVREAHAITRSLSHFPLQAAFRYNRKAADAPKLQLEWREFSDADVLSAVVERATVTTLVNVEGRTLTEITLRVRNHSQAFVKVGLPPGATLVSAEVEGKPVRPVEGSDGSRVPLLRPGLNPSGAYDVSLVYHSSGARFTKAGSYDMGLPSLDIPINLLTWEVALPERLQVKQFGGNAFAAELFPMAAQSYIIDGADDDDEVNAAIWTRNDLSSIEAGQIGGIVVDANGAVVAGAEVTLNTQSGSSLNTTSDSEGRWVIANVAPGPVTVSISAPGFKRMNQDFNYDNSRPVRIGTTMEVASVTETVTVTAQGLYSMEKESKRIEQQLLETQAAQITTPSQNVFNLQRRVAGILPVRIEVPRGGRSYRFVRPLVMDEETRITFQYKSSK